MPIIRENHFVRARAEREMARLSATDVERNIHNKLAELHWATGRNRPAEPAIDGGAA